MKNVSKKNKNKTRRKDLGERCKLIEAGAIDVVVCRDIMHIARPKYKSRFFNWSQTFFEEHQVQIHCIQDGLLDFSDKMTSIMTFMQQAIVDDELEKRVENSLKEISKLHGEGIYLSKAPFGYEKEGNKYRLHPVHSKTVKMGFDLKEKGVLLDWIDISPQLHFMHLLPKNNSFPCVILTIRFTAYTV